MTAFVTENSDLMDIEIYLTEKESRDRELDLDLRAKGIITTPGDPFELPRQQEIDRLKAIQVLPIQ